jgi:predicted GNAT family acetyltransferase
MSNTQQWNVVHNAAQSRFETTVDGQLSEAAYRLRGGVMTMTHTSVPTALEGRGIAASLVEKAIAHARDQGLKIEPQCAYVASYMQRHPEARDVLA